MRQFLMSILYLVVFFVISYVVVEFILPYLWPFLLAFLLAVFIDPLVCFGENTLRIPRRFSVLIAMIGVSAFVAMLLTFVVSRLILELSEIQTLVPSYLQRQIVAFINEIVQKVGEYSEFLPTELTSIIDKQMAVLQSWVNSIVNILLRVPNLLGSLIITIISAYFISKDKDSIEKIIVNMLPKSLQKKVAEAQGSVIRSTVQLIEIQAVLVICTSVLVILALWVARIKYALVLGIISGILDIVPVLGPSLLFIPWAVYAILTGSIGLGIYLLIVYAVIAVGRQLLTVRVVGMTVGLHPLTTLVGLYVGAQVFGAKGLVIGPLVAMILKALIISGAFPGLSHDKSD